MSVYGRSPKLATDRFWRLGGCELIFRQAVAVHVENSRRFKPSVASRRFASTGDVWSRLGAAIAPASQAVVGILKFYRIDSSARFKFSRPGSCDDPDRSRISVQSAQGDGEWMTKALILLIETTARLNKG